MNALLVNEAGKAALLKQRLVMKYLEMLITNATSTSKYIGYFRQDDNFLMEPIIYSPILEILVTYAARIRKPSAKAVDPTIGFSYYTIDNSEKEYLV